LQLLCLQRVAVKENYSARKVIVAAQVKKDWLAIKLKK